MSSDSAASTLALSATDILRTALRESSSSSPDDDLLLSLLTTFSLPPSSSSSSSIPSLSSTSKENTLVSFRCMLQDTTYPPEIFLPLREGEQQSAAEEDGEGEIDYSKLRERGVVFAVGVPGEQDWVEEILNPSSTSSLASTDEPQPHKSISHKFPYLKAKAGDLAGKAERIGAFVKTYDSTTPSPPTSVQTYIGLLTFSSPPSALESDAPAGEEDPQIPTIHVLKTIEHSGPLVPLEKLAALTGREEWNETRRELIKLIAEVGLGGEEEWVAEWVLVALCSKNLPPLNPLTLSLLLPTSPSSSSPTTTATQLSPLPLLSLLPALLPLFHPLPLSLPLLNLSSLAPRSTPTEDLAAGALQLPKGGLLYIDETPLGEGGKLTERGMRNLEVVKKVVKEQRVEYEFEYSKFGFAMDLGVLVVGEGRGGLIEVDAKIHLHRPSTPFASTTPLALPTNDKLMKFRSLLARAREGSLVVPKEVSESIQTSFVTHRATHGPSSLTPEDLSLRMKLARGLALSRNLPELDLATWEDAWKLDEKRIERSKEEVPLLGKPDVLEGVKEESDDEDELEIEGGPVGGTGSARGGGGRGGHEKMVGR